MATATATEHVPSANAIRGMNLEHYHERPEWSHSQLEVLADSPPLFAGRFIDRVFPAPKSDVFDDGTIVHAALTGGQSIEDLVAVIPPGVLDASGARRGAAWKAWSAEHADKIQRKPEEVDALRRMVDSVRAHPKAKWLLDLPGDFELSIFWTDPATGLRLRARPDKLAELYGDMVLVDLKSTRATDHRKFSSDIAQYGYHRQAAWYLDSVEAMAGATDLYALSFCIITVDKTPAHECHVYELLPSAIHLGREQNAALVAELAHRLQNNDWHSRDFGAILEIDVPSWCYQHTQPWREVA